MKTAIARVATAAFGPGLIPGWMILACSLAAAAPEPPATDGTQTVALSYTEVSHSVSTVTLWGHMLELQRSPFAKEPAFGSPAAVSRGILKCFGPTTNDVRFLWHRGERKLWLDLNRNGDLSDDPDGLFVSPAMASGSTADLSFGEFKSIPIARWLGGTPGKALVDLHFSYYGSQPRVTVNWRSCWLGKARLQGEDWQVGLLENPEQFPAGSLAAGQAGSEPEPARQGEELARRYGIRPPTSTAASQAVASPARAFSIVLLRHWERRSEPFAKEGQTADTVPWADTVFLGKEGYSVARQIGIEGGQLQVSMTFRPAALETVPVTLKGEHVRRLVLEQPNPPLVAIFEQPGNTLSLPPGKYYDPKVFLRNGKDEAYSEVHNYYGSNPHTPITVQRGEPLALAAGGPLTNRVTLARRGGSLTIDYQLLGADAQRYTLAHADRSKPPAFRISRDGKVIHTGNFEFG